MAETVATTSAGEVRGVAISEGVVFRGIPFAAPPTGARRYLPPAPPSRWEGVRDCSAFGAICPQRQADDAGGVLAALGTTESADEDCLFLNIWTPAIDDARRPTMVWIHGGSFFDGSGSTPLYDGAAFARDGIVLVTINYRLHTLGFLYLDEFFDDATGTGNLGIQDQVAALQWVRANIARFGGNPDNVTIFGESAGGMSVGTLLATPSASGLFHRAILQSGAAHHNLSVADAKRVAARALELAAVRPGDWKALREVPAPRMVQIASQLNDIEAGALLADDRAARMPFQPVVEGTARTAKPIDLIRNGAAAGIDLLVGTCADEWSLFIWATPEGPNLWLPDVGLVAPYFEGAGRSIENVQKVYAESRPSMTSQEVLAAVETDLMFTIPAIRLAEAQLAYRDRVWMYRFSWPTPVLNGALGACHCLELPFVFGTLDLPGISDLVGARPPHDMATAMRAAWVSFARTGDPNGGLLPDWPAYETEHRHVMDFDVDRRVLKDPCGRERRLWDGAL
jgi:para-nitrobenzyl esterase